MTNLLTKRLKHHHQYTNLFIEGMVRFLKVPPTSSSYEIKIMDPI